MYNLFFANQNHKTSGNTRFFISSALLASGKFYRCVLINNTFHNINKFLKCLLENKNGVVHAGQIEQIILQRYV